MNNELAAYLRLYDEQMGPTPSYQRSPSPWMSEEATSQLNNASAYNARSARLSGAMGLMNQAQMPTGRDAPNFFADQAGPAYVQPQQFREEPPRAQQDPRIVNMLAQMMGRR